MNPLTLRAKDNPKKARQWIALFNALLAIVALFTGQWFYYNHIYFSDSFRAAGILIALSGFFLYPFRNLYDREEKKDYLAIRKKTDIFLIAGSALIFLYTGNHFYEYFTFTGFPALYAGSPSPVISVPGFSCQAAAAPVPLLFQKLSGLGLFAKILLFLLLLVLGILLGYLILIMGCGIACAGYETAGSLFILGGGIWLIPAIILAGHHLFGKKGYSGSGLLLRQTLGITGTAGILLTTLAVATVLAQVHVMLLVLSAIILGLSLFYVISLFKKRG
ncbi:MAG: hypothetical protein K1X92_17245 [Bacteroidia bacterium]|nr:hypothetical protein [Bacteroidia bacterium]